MQRSIKLACVVITVSLLAGAFVYGAVMAAYRLADALSLSPALKNLAPLAAVAVVWLMASIVMKCFNRRAQHRSVPQTASSVSRDPDEERRQVWLQIRAKGMKRYVWRTGVIGWGLPVFAIFTPLMLGFGPRTHHLSKAEIVGSTIFSLFVWMAGGYVFGRLMWKTLEKRYR